jgi:hypothetical protein
MVGDKGQLYTIEGVAAAILMVVTAYVILNSNYIITPGDTHINDLQLEQLGNDVLRMMDTAVDYTDTADMYEAKKSLLQRYISGEIPPPTDDFPTTFQKFADPEDLDSLSFQALVYYRDNNGIIQPYPIYNPPTMTGREHSVHVTKWVLLDSPNPGFNNARNGPQTVLLEVQLWRD